MQTFFKWLGALLAPEPDPINNPYAKATTPDELIASAVIQSLATDFESWSEEFSGYKTFPPNYVERITKSKKEYSTEGVGYTLRSKKVEVTFYLKWTKYRVRFGVYDTRFQSSNLQTTDVRVNDVAVSDAVGFQIFKSYRKLKQDTEAAKATAAKAKAEMEANERKWNLAEDLLGMKRLPTGALVPKETVDDCGPSDERVKASA